MPEENDELPQSPPETAYAGEGPTGGSTWRQTPTGTGAARLRNEGAPLEVIGDFEILGKLGQGGMGTVYRARQRSLDRQVALKILPATFEADAEFVSRFQREARVAASLSHANLVRVYASGHADGCHFIAMELIEGETLGDWLKRGPLSPAEALRVLLDVARALECGWQRAQLVHRDIKPGNIFLSMDGAVKLGDLGLAKTLGGDSTGLTQTGAMMGTPHYISPEQARADKEIDFRADIYSLGCTLYQMLTGRTPYGGSDPMSVMLQHVNAPPPAILKALPQCPIPLARLVGKMLKKGKHERHASYGELIAQIESVQALFATPTSLQQTTIAPEPGVNVSQTPNPPTPRPATATTQLSTAPKSKLPFYCGIAALILAIALGGVFFLLPRKEKLTKAQLYARQKAAEPPGAVSQGEGTESALSAPTPGAANAPSRPSPTALAPLRFGGHRYVVAANGNLEVHEARAKAMGGHLATITDAREWQAVVQWLGVWPRETRFLIGATRSADNQPWVWGTGEPFNFSAWTDAAGPQRRGAASVAAIDFTRDEGGWNSVPRGWSHNFSIVEWDHDETPASTTESWQDALSDPVFIPGEFLERTGEGLVFLKNRTWLLKQGPGPDGAIRTTYRFPGGADFTVPACRMLGDRWYFLSFPKNRQTISIQRKDGGDYQTIAEAPFPPSLVVGEEVTFELRAVGSRLTGRVNGVVAVEGDDHTFADGEFGLWTRSTSPLLISRIETLKLNRSPAPSASATKDAPVP